MIQIVVGDCRRIVAGKFDMILADPPYGQTSLVWDRRCEGWQTRALSLLKPTGSMWVFGSMRFLLETWPQYEGWRLAQDIVWEKHNGTNLAADRFRRVHEHCVHLYAESSRWSDVWNSPQTTNDAAARVVRKKAAPARWFGAAGETTYVSEEGGPRLVRSVIRERSVHGSAIHPTEKPVSLVELLVRTSCPPGGMVLDLFAGSGSAGEACKRSGRQYLGCEIDPEMARKAASRIDDPQQIKSLPLFAA